MKHVNVLKSFLENHVNLNQSRLDTLQARVSAIENFIESDTAFGDLLVDTIPAGSWAHETIIRPVTDADGFDADLLIQVMKQSDWQPKDYIENLYTSFRTSYRYRDIVQRKTRCLRINYAGEFHIDLVPFVEDAGFTYITNRLDPVDFGKFEMSYPDNFTEWIDQKQRATNGNFVKAVRLIKYLRDHKNTFTCKSIILMTLLGERVNEIEAELNPALYADLPTTLDTLMSRLADWLPTFMPSIMDPAGSGDDFASRYGTSWNYENFRSRMTSYAEQISAAILEDDEDKSITYWQAIFGSDFSLTSTTKALQSIEALAGVPWSGEEFIDRDLGFQNPEKKPFRVKMVGRCSGYGTSATKRRRGFRQFNLPSKGNRVETARQLRFTIAATTVPEPYEVYWKVRNGGADAQRAGELRGEIRADSGNRSLEEHTAYKGTHYVECYIVKNGVVVASDRQAVVVI